MSSQVWHRKYAKHPVQTSLFDWTGSTSLYVNLTIKTHPDCSTAVLTTTVTLTRAAALILQGLSEAAAWPVVRRPSGMPVGTRTSMKMKIRMTMKVPLR